MSIEKNILQVSIGLNHKHPHVQQVTQKMLDINKSHTYFLIETEQEMDDWVINNYLNSKDNFLHTAGKIYFEIPKIVFGGQLENNSLVSKIDFFRILFIYREGGFYLDMDAYFHTDIDEFTAGTDMYLTFFSCNIWTSIFFCKKKHPILKFVIQKIILNSYNKVKGIMALCGPYAMCNGVIDGHNFYQNENIKYPVRESMLAVDLLRGKSFVADGFKYKFSKNIGFGSGKKATGTDEDYRGYLGCRMKNHKVLYEGTGKIHWMKEFQDHLKNKKPN